MAQTAKTDAPDAAAEAAAAAAKAEAEAKAAADAEAAKAAKVEAEAKAKAEADAAALEAKAKKAVAGAVYAVVHILPGFKPGDRLDGHLAQELLDVLLREGSASHDAPASTAA